MSTDPQLAFFDLPNDNEDAPSLDVASHDTTLPEAAAAAVAAPRTVPSANRVASTSVEPKRKDPLVLSAKPLAEERYLSVQDVARRYAISIQTVWRHTKHNPEFPKPIKILAGSTRWKISDILAYDLSRHGGGR